MKKILIICLISLLTSKVVSAQIGDVDDKGWISDENGNTLGKVSIKSNEFLAGFSSEYVVVERLGGGSRNFVYVSDFRGKTHSSFYLGNNESVKNVTNSGIISTDGKRSYLYGFDGTYIRSFK
jgi:hypothetical protein